MLRLAVRHERLDRGRLLSHKARCADRVENDVALLHRVDAVDLVASQRCDDALSLLGAVVSEQPTRTLGQPDHGNADTEREEALEGDRETPDEVAGAVGRAVVDPVRHQRAESDDATLDTDQEAAVGRFAALG